MQAPGEQHTPFQGARIYFLLNLFWNIVSALCPCLFTYCEALFLYVTMTALQYTAVTLPLPCMC